MGKQAGSVYATPPPLLHTCLQHNAAPATSYPNSIDNCPQGKGRAAPSLGTMHASAPDDVVDVCMAISEGTHPGTMATA